MPQLRSSPGRQLDVAIEDLLAVGDGARGVEIRRHSDDTVDVTVGRHTWTARVETREAVGKHDVDALAASTHGQPTILVANRVSSEAKDAIEAVNRSRSNGWWSWLDRRGELQLNHPESSGVVNFVGADRTGRSGSSDWRIASPRFDGPIRGRAGLSYAAVLLLDPERRPSIREVAAEAGMSHGAVGDAAKSLREVGLVLPTGAPQIPELFWALADVWGPTRLTPVAAVPSAAQVDRLGANGADLDEPGWALGGDAAAAAWGAPIFSAGDVPWIWLPTEADARRVERSLGGASWENHAAVLAVAPTLVACRHRMRPHSHTAPDVLPTLHPLFLALELAQDPSRGREILDEWRPDDAEVRRVW